MIWFISIPWALTEFFFFCVCVVGIAYVLNCDTSIIFLYTSNNGLYFYKVNYMYLFAIYSSSSWVCVCNTIKIYKTYQLKNWDYSQLECQPLMFLIPNILQLSVHFFNQHLSWICKKVAYFFHAIRITNLISEFGWS